MTNVIGRITLFNFEKTGKINEPELKGYMETRKGKYTVTLWREPNDKVTGGYILKGQVVQGDK